MLFSKYILLESGQLIFGKVSYHKNLLQEGEKCIGGGGFHVDLENDTVTLFGESHDYGSAPLEKLREAVEAGSIFTGAFRSNNAFTGYIFRITRYGETHQLSK